MAKLFFIISCCFGLSAVVLGAFSAHFLKKHLSSEHLAVFQTGVQYQFYHAFLLLIIALLLKHSSSAWLNYSAISASLGILCFSGSLYALALTGIKWFGPITPIGGLLFILAWLFLIIFGIKEY